MCGNAGTGFTVWRDVALHPRHAFLSPAAYDPAAAIIPSSGRSGDAFTRANAVGSAIQIPRARGCRQHMAPNLITAAVVANPPLCP